MAASENLTPEQRSLRSRIAANISWARTVDRSARTRPAVNAGPASISYWEKKVDPDGLMDEQTRIKAAGNAKKAHFQRLAYLAAKARRRAK